MPARGQGNGDHHRSTYRRHLLATVLRVWQTESYPRIRVRRDGTDHFRTVQTVRRVPSICSVLQHVREWPSPKTAFFQKTVLRGGIVLRWVRKGLAAGRLYAKQHRHRERWQNAITHRRTDICSDKCDLPIVTNGRERLQRAGYRRLPAKVLQTRDAGERPPLGQAAGHRVHVLQTKIPSRRERKRERVCVRFLHRQAGDIQKISATVHRVDIILFDLWQQKALKLHNELAFPVLLPDPEEQHSQHEPVIWWSCKLPHCHQRPSSGD